MPTTTPPFVDGKQLIAWNALQLRGLLALLAASPEPALRDRAQALLHALRQRLPVAFASLSRDQELAGDAALDDYVELGWALLEAAASGLGPEAELVGEAKQLAMSAAANYLDGPRAAVWDTLLDDGEIIAPAAPLCGLLNRLLQRGHEEPLAAATTTCWTRLQQALQRRDGPSWSQLRWLEARSHGGIDRSARFAEGHGRLHLQGKPDGSIAELRLELAPGWHVNASTPTTTSLRRLAIRAVDGDADLGAEFPPAMTRRIASIDATIDVYEGEVRIPLKGAYRGPLVVDVQACSEDICLLPEQRLLRTW